MNIARRLYFYAVSFVSLEVVIWGLIGVARSIFSGTQLGSQAGSLAGALALILVGLPVFLLHWFIIQRQALADLSERSQRVRAIFLYALLASLLIPAIQNGLAFLNRLLLSLFGANPQLASLGGYQSAPDNFTALALNLLGAAYIFSVLRADWRSGAAGEDFAETRRLHRHLWLLYSLLLSVFGAQGVLFYIFQSAQLVSSGSAIFLANGLALLLTGLPIWVFTTNQLYRANSETEDRHSLMRLAFLHSFVFAGVAVVLVTAGQSLQVILRLLLGESLTPASLLDQISRPLSYTLPFAAVWSYFAARLRTDHQYIPPSPRRAALARLYRYVLALFGLAAFVIGLHNLFGVIVQLLLSAQILGAVIFRQTLATALAAIFVGLPLWLLTWRPSAAEAAVPGEAGDHARRSLIRRSYLYLVLFACLMGLMVSAGLLLYQFLRRLLGDPAPDLVLQAVLNLRSLLLAALFLYFHRLALNHDARLAEKSLHQKHASSPLLILAPQGSPLASELLAALQREAPALPVALHDPALGVPPEPLAAARLVILPSDLFTQPSNAIQLWLQDFTGSRLVIPLPAAGWEIVTAAPENLPTLARQAARRARAFAEGEDLLPSRENHGWLIVVYLLAALFALQILLGISVFLFNLF